MILWSVSSRSAVRHRIALSICGIGLVLASGLAGSPLGAQSTESAVRNQTPAVTPNPPHPPRGVQIGEPTACEYWRIGVRLKGGREVCKNLLVTLPLPADWPEQSVRVIGKQVPPEVQKLNVRQTTPTLQQLVASVAVLRPEQELILTYDLEVTLRKILPPTDPTVFRISKTVPKELREYLDVSPGISFRDSKLRNTVKDLVKSQERAWDQVHAIYEWVQQTIEPRGGDPSDTVDCFRERKGTGEDIAGLFVAMCRAHKVPARMVWVDEFQYAEFYLWDDQEQGHWIPCIFGGYTEFGGIATPKMIEMKGDNFRVPEKEEPQKFVFEFLAGEATARPQVHFVRQRLPAAEIKEPKK